MIYFDFSIQYDKEQQLTSTIKQEDNTTVITIVYAKYNVHLREPLWDDLWKLSSMYKEDWIMIGDFNSIIDPSEKQGGRPHRMEKRFPFIECIRDCELHDLGYIGSTFTWCNHKVLEKRI